MRLIDENAEQRGVMPTVDALQLARDAGLDLVEVSPTERPPVCKIMDYGKHRYLQSKRSRQRSQENRIKEVRLRPKTDPHDKDIKMKRARSFIEDGHRVQFTMRFRGRERFHREIGMNTLSEIAHECEDIAKIERPARMLGHRMTMVLVPLKPASKPAGKTQPARKPPVTKAIRPPTETATPPPAPPLTSEPVVQPVNVSGTMPK